MLLRNVLTILSLALLVTTAGGFTSAQSISQQSAFLKPEAVVVAKKVPVMTETARSYLRQRDGDFAKVWVFFTDKDVHSKSSFEKRASSVVVTGKVLKRRNKVKLGYIVFADLPVPSKYIGSIVNIGGKHRRTSKWLNAASFEVPAGKLDEIANLPFVSSISPVAVYRREPVEAFQFKPDELTPQRQSPDVLDYGNSSNQLTQINVPVVHEKGYHGEGVTLAILDTGYRKSHEAFAAHFAEGRVLAEYDFVFNDSNTSNEPLDHPSQYNHGTLIWSTSGGLKDGIIYGPAYKANFLLAKTEDIRSETPIEEDNWVAALEWADSLGADVLTSSLGYIAWYDPSDVDGATAVTTVAANMAASMGILVCNSAGNGGPASGTLNPPSDAHDILAVGAVNGLGTIAGFSSRGPTFDGRIKPEVCARGVSTWCATASQNNSYGTASGTSLSTPLVAGAACLLVQARPTFPPVIIRQALMETADNSDSPDNTYGWGIINTDAALSWGAEFSADITAGNAPLTIQFTSNSSLTPSSWLWSFGDGDSSSLENPSHQYLSAGTYDVSLTLETAFGTITNLQRGFVVLYADTVQFEIDSALAGQPAIISVNLVNSQDLQSMVIPFKYDTVLEIHFDSVSLGSRTSYFESLTSVEVDAQNNRYAYQLLADNGGGAPPLAPGSGEVMRIYLTIDSLALGGFSALVDTTSFPGTKLLLLTSTGSYEPGVITGSVGSKVVLWGDANYDFAINILDLTYLVDYIFRGGPPSVTIQAGDLTQDFNVNVEDLTYLIDFIFRGGPPPPVP